MPGKICIPIIALYLLLSAPVQAAGARPDLRFYLGGALGFASASDSNCDYHGYNCDGNDSLFKLYAGKRLHENFAVEVAYNDLGKLKNKRSSLTTTAATDAINLSLLAIIPVDGLGFFYGKAGAMAWEADYVRIGSEIARSDDDGTDFTYGAGFAFTFGGKYDFRIEYERLNELGDEYVAGGSTVSAFNFAGTIYID